MSEPRRLVTLTGMNIHAPSCPDCGTALGPAPLAHCPSCRLPLSGPDAGALWQVTTALQGLEAHRLVLLGQRERLLAGLRDRRDAPGGAAVGGAVPGVPAAPRGWAAPPAAVRPAEVSGPSAQTVLLVLGGLLVTVAALVFTVVSWGQLGIGGRAAVLLALTLCALALPLPLRRRRLTATAEASAAVGLALVLLDCYAARAAGLAGLDRGDDATYWAAATALVAIGSAGYGWALRMRLPLPAGFLLGHLPGLLIAAAVGATSATGYANAVVVTAAVDGALLWAAAPRGAVPRAALQQRFGGKRSTHQALLTAAAVVGVFWAVLSGVLAATESLTADHLAGAAGAWVPLGLLALLGFTLSAPQLALPPVQRRLPVRIAASVSTAAVLVATGGTLRFALPTHWWPVAFAAPAALVAVLAGLVLTRSGPRVAPVATLGVLTTGAAALGVSTLAVAPDLVQALLRPLQQVSATWSDQAASSWDWGVPPAALTVLWLLTLVLALVAARLRRHPATGALRIAAVVAAVPAVALLPVALDLPYRAVVAVAGVLSALAAVPLLRRSTTTAVTPPALIAPAATAALTLLWALADRGSTIAAWGGLAVLFGVLAGALSAPVSDRAARSTATFAATAAVLVLGVEAAAIGATAGLATATTAFAVLAVAAASAPVAAALRPLPGREQVSSAVEYTGYGLACTALLMTVYRPGALSLCLALTGVVALGVALREDRRRVAAPAATALLIASSWVRLALADVHSPEAYTLSVSAAALVIGLLRRRRDPAASSWVGYGVGLSVTMLPSLVATWTDGHWLRPLLLGAAALAATVLGVRFRLQAPLVVGGAVLLLVAVHELAPTVVQVLGLMPRWVPLAMAGLLLLLLGSTYERRLRDARRLREGLRRMG